MAAAAAAAAQRGGGGGGGGGGGTNAEAAGGGDAAGNGGDAGGGGGDGCREPDPPPGSGASSEQIMRTGALLLRGFIWDHVERCGDAAALALGRAELGAEPGAGPAPGAGPGRGTPDTKRLSECLRRIGDELDQNAELQRVIAAVGCEAPKELFFKVAAELFSDGAFNWGRVVALFYFACKLVLKALCARLPELVRTILAWTMEYVREHVLGWIQAQGGWDGLLSSSLAPSWQALTLFAAGVLTASLTIWKMS